MRILYAVTSAGFGGASMHVLQLMRFMVREGHTVGLISAPEPRLLSEAEKLGVKVFPNPYFVRRLHILNDIRAFYPIFKAIKEFKPDLIHAHSTKAGLIVRFWSAILNIRPVIFTAHGWAFTEGRAYWKRWLLAQIEKIAAIATTKIICVSEHDRQLALRFKVTRPDKLIVIHNGVDLNEFFHEGEKKDGDEIILTFVGRLAPPKDLFTLINAVKNLSEVKLQIVGDGEMRDVIEKYIHLNGLAEKVILLGERLDVPEILSKTDIFVLTSNWEGLPLTIIEAMMAGLPVVATAVGGVPELVDDGLTGFLVPPKDVETLTQKLKILINDEALRKKMGEEGKKKALSKFTLERMLAETLAVYEEVLSENKIPIADVKNS